MSKSNKKDVETLSIEELRKLLKLKLGQFSDDREAIKEIQQEIDKKIVQE